MYDHDSNDREVKESAVAKSTGEQDEKNMLMQDAALFRVLSSGKKISKEEAEYREDQRKDNADPDKPVCGKCKFNLGDEKKCHVVEGDINNEYGSSKFFSAMGEGMLPGDIVWNFIKKIGRKLKYEEGYVIENGADGFRCKDCKFYMYSGNCLLIRGKFKPEMSCGFIVKIGNGTDV
jgi:hypothetical protein